MKPPFTLNSKILLLCTEITRLLGRLEGIHMSKPTPKLRKANRVRTIQASLAIEGNSIGLEQVTALFDGKRVLGPKREILEVTNAIRAYEGIGSYKAHSIGSLREAHGLLMKGLVEDAGKWRSKNVGIFQGSRVTHSAPQPKRVPELMEQLFSFIKSEKSIHPLILSATFHYELEFIHPFSDGNGRMGRLWQTTMLSKFHPIFEFTPLESVVRERQESYYNALGLSDKAGDSGVFIEFSLETILEALKDLSDSFRPQPLSAAKRLEIASENFQSKEFSRKDYLSLFKSLSSATASRDLAYGVLHRKLTKTGDKSRTMYCFS